jgi:hypothetical protein
MNSNRNGRRVVAVIGGAAFIAVSVLTAGCANNSNQAPSPTTTTTTTTTSPSSAAPISPTEKGITPTGANSFGPQVLAPPAPTEPPGVHRHREG